MKRIYLHIGPHKTGTTSIQTALMGGRGGEAIEGMDCLQQLRSGTAHHQLAIQLAQGPLAEVAALAAQVKAVIDGSTCDEFALSSEEFSHLDTGRCTILAGALAGYDVRIVVVLRNQLDWLAAHYFEASKKNIVGSPGDYVFKKVQGKRGPNWWRLVERWRKAFGPQAVRVIIYEDHEDVVDPVLKAMGGRKAGRPGPRLNPSLNVRFALAHQEVLRRSLDGELDPTDARGRLSRILDFARSRPEFTAAMPFMPDDDAQAVMAIYANGNRRLQSELPLPECYFHAETCAAAVATASSKEDADVLLAGSAPSGIAAPASLRRLDG